MKVRVTSLWTGQTVRVSLEAAAETTQLSVHEIEWALEEYGVCETEDYIISPIEIPAIGDDQ